MRFTRTSLVWAVYYFLNTSALILPQSDFLVSEPASRSLNLNNLTLALPTPPGHFHLSFEITGPKLRQTACLMNTVHALRTLALGEFDARIIDGTEFRLDRYPEVSISISTPKRKRSIMAKFIIWAIVLGVHEMIQEKKFQLAQFEMRWNNQVFGWVHIADNPVRHGLAINGGNSSGAVDVAKRSSLALPSNFVDPLDTDAANFGTTATASDPAEARLTTIFSPIGGNLGIYDIFYPIMNTLADMADFPGTRQCDALFAGADDYKGVICVLPIFPVRTQPPFLDYQWLIRMVSRILDYMVDNARFGEIEISMSVDGVPIANGEFSNTACF